MVLFDCPRCGQRLMVPDAVAGRRVQCPRCRSQTDAPQVPAGATAAVADSVSDRPTVPPSQPAARPPHAAPPRTDPELCRFLAPPQRPDEIGRLGPYRVLQVLGSGGMGVVFRAEDVQLRRPVALKAMLPALSADPKCRERFFREARAAAAIEHDHIVTVYQVGDDRGVPFLAMRLLQGETLEARLRRCQRLPVPAVLKMAREIADGLDAAHERGLVHRDVKPSNIWLEAGRDRVKLLDFGLARVTQGDQELTQSGVLIGTPAYVAPEQARGEPATPRSDLFSLGCVMYRMCTGELPFKGRDTLATLSALALEEPPPVTAHNPEVPPALAALVTKLLAKDPARRPPSARAVAEAIAAIDRGLTPPGPHSDAVSADGLAIVDDTEALVLLEPARRPLRDWVLLAACDLMALALLVSGLVFLYRVLAGR